MILHISSIKLAPSVAATAVVVSLSFVFCCAEHNSGMVTAVSTVLSSQFSVTTINAPTPAVI